MHQNMISQDNAVRKSFWRRQHQASLMLSLLLKTKTTPISTLYAANLSEWETVAFDPYRVPLNKSYDHMNGSVYASVSFDETHPEAIGATI